MPNVTTSIRTTSMRTNSMRAVPSPTQARSAMRLYPVRVSRVRQLSPNFRRITLVGERLITMPFAGADQRVKLILPQPGQAQPHVDDTMGVLDMLRLPADVRPVVRTYTIRHHRPAAAEVDVDFALHGELGPASRWAQTARPGDHAALYGPAAEYEPPEDTQWQLIVGDDTALPAVAAIVESLRSYDRAQVIVEVADAADIQDLDSPADIEIRWLVRGHTPAHESSQLLEAVRATELPALPSYFWLAGESSIVTAIRRHLVTERAVSRDDVQFTGYWRHGVREDER